MKGNSICIPKKVNMTNKDPIKIEQDNINYCLNIGINEDIIRFSLLNKENLLSVNYFKTMSFQEIKDLNKIFLGLSSFNDFYEYLQTLSVNKKLNIEKSEEKLSLILLAEYLSKPEIIKINLSRAKIDLDLNIKNICEELLSMKEKIKDIEILKSENKSLKEKQDREIDCLKEKIKENEIAINGLKEKVEKQNKEMSTLNEKLNENVINGLKEKFEKQSEEINNLKAKSNENDINELKEKIGNQNKEINTLKESLNEKQNKNEVNELKEKVDKQNKEINTLKENLKGKENKNEVNLLKKNIEHQNKEINTLKENLNKLNEMKDKSVIMNYDEKIMIFAEIESKMKKKIKEIKKLYQATIDGGDPINFHSKCDNIENTLVLIKSEGLRRFGGFTPIPWKSNGNNKDDPSSNSFIFSLDKQKIYSLKQGWYSVYHDKSNGPSFGYDIKIEGNPLKEKILYTKKWSYDYKGDNYSLLDNTNKIKALEYEVFQIIFF